MNLLSLSVGWVNVLNGDSTGRSVVSECRIGKRSQTGTALVNLLSLGVGWVNGPKRGQHLWICV